MSWPESTYHEVATLWRQGATDQYGTISWATPVACRVAWAEKATLYRDQSGQDKVGKAAVLIDREAAVGDRLMLGSSTAVAPSSSSEPIVSVEHQLKLDRTGYVWRVIL